MTLFLKRFLIMSTVGDIKMFDWKVLLIILLIVVVIFGTKRLRSIGSDIGAGIKGVKEGFDSGEPKSSPLKSLNESEAPSVRTNAETEARERPNRD
jgi:sec-independent protein translocase protein TatA